MVHGGAAGSNRMFFENDSKHRSIEHGQEDEDRDNLVEVLADVSAAIKAAQRIKKSEQHHNTLSKKSHEGEVDTNSISPDLSQKMSLRLDILKMSENRLEDSENRKKEGIWREERALSSLLDKSREDDKEFWPIREIFRKRPVTQQ